MNLFEVKLLKIFSDYIDTIIRENIILYKLV